MNQKQEKKLRKIEEEVEKFFDENPNIFERLCEVLDEMEENEDSIKGNIYATFEFETMEHELQGIIEEHKVEAYRKTFLEECRKNVEMTVACKILEKAEVLKQANEETFKQEIAEIASIGLQKKCIQNTRKSMLKIIKTENEIKE